MSVPFLQSAAKEYAAYGSLRGRVNARSNEALSLSKRAIFSVHRDDLAEAKRQLAQAQDHFAEIERMVKQVPALAYEGSYRVAREEFLEATLLSQYVKNGKIGALPKQKADARVVIGAASDFTGELVRYAVRQATLGNRKAVSQAQHTVEEVVGILLAMDLTGELRQKFDQAKSNMRKMEEIAYDLAIRSKK